ncbi:CcdB family protein [Ottowia testudinis]|nr:CcdB family protein [Ottowia testudinis]
MPRFDLYPNPNRRAGHALLLDVQSDLVTIATRW